MTIKYIFNGEEVRKTKQIMDCAILFNGITYLLTMLSSQLLNGAYELIFSQFSLTIMNFIYASAINHYITKVMGQW
jgi:hypothetical protein